MSQHFRDFSSISPETSVSVLYEVESDARNDGRQAARSPRIAVRHGL
jgi:hypothetical protein